MDSDTVPRQTEYFMVLEKGGRQHRYARAVVKGMQRPYIEAIPHQQCSVEGAMLCMVRQVFAYSLNKQTLIGHIRVAFAEKTVSGIHIGTSQMG